MSATRDSSVLRRRTFLQIAGAGGLTVALASCTSGASTTDVRFWLTPNASPKEMSAFTADMAKGFKKVAPKDGLTALVIPWENALTKYTTAYSSMNPPDVAYQIVPWLNKWRSTGVLADFNKLGTKEEIESMTKGAPKSYLDAARGENGELYAIPFTQGYFSLAINEDIWQKAGSPTIPSTLEDMIPFAQKMTFDTGGRRLGDPGFDPKNVANYGFSWPAVPSIQDNYVWSYLWAFGSDYISADRKDIGFDNPEGRAALKHMKAIVDSGAATPPGLYADDTKWGDALVSGKAAMQWTESLTADQAQRYPKARLKVIPLPSGPKSRVIVGGCGYYSVAAKSKNKVEAYKLAKFLLSPESADRYVRMILAHPTRPVEGDYYKAPLADPRMNVFLNQASSYAPFARCTLILPYQPQEFLLGKINDYLYGKQSLDAMIAEASTGIKQMAKTAG